jgi:Tfp pilus assembly protein PilF
MGENFALLARFYYRPIQAASDALDHASFGFALVMAALTMMLWTIGPGRGLFFGGLFLVFATFLVMAPVSICVVAAWDGLGSAGVVLRREYLSFVICALIAWAAANLPFGILAAVAGSAVLVPGLSVGAHIAFLILFVICLRTALGTTTLHAIAAMVAGWIAMLGSVMVWPLVGNLSYFLLSPWVLYMLYRAYSPDLGSLGDAMSSRRNFRRQLDAAMVNPRDADAHYQLGLIYMQRRQLDEAASSFRRAIDILPQEAEAQLHLGRVLRAQGKPAEALAHLQAAVNADTNVSLQEGWRDLGATLLDLGQVEQALPILERYTNRRSYDPEGLFAYAMALRRSNRHEEARQAFQQTIEAAQTAPAYRRAQLRRWANQARSELKAG